MSVRGIVAELAKAGVAADEFLHECGIDPMALSSSRLTISRDHFERVVCRALEVTQIPHLGLAVGSATPEFQLMAQFASALPTLREAIARLIQYAPIFADPLSMALSQHGKTARFAFALQADYSAITARFSAEMFAALCAGLAMQNFTGTAPQKVHFAHGSPSYAARYEEALGCAVVFDAPEHCIEFDAALLDVRQPRADSFIVDMLTSSLDALLSAQAAPMSRAETLRHWITARPDLCSVQLPDLCRSLGTTERLLRKQLHKEGTSFSRLLNEVRIEVALKEMRRPSSNLKQVAARLGYSDVSSFHRAFKRWTGKTPFAYMRSDDDAASRDDMPGTSVLPSSD